MSATTGPVVPKPSAPERPRIVDLDLWGGWCTVRFKAEGETVDLRGHWSTDCFTDLICAVTDVIGLRRTASCRFMRETGGGGFVDLALDRDEGLCVAVHETFYGTNVRTSADLNSAARGKLLLETRVPLKDFVRDFLRALQRIRVLTVDAGGLPAHWPHTFPVGLYENLEREATRRLAYRPVMTYEITGEHPGPFPKRDPGTFGPSVE